MSNINDPKEMRVLLESLFGIEDAYQPVQFEEEQAITEDEDGAAVFEELAEELLEFAHRLSNAIDQYAPDQARYWDAYGIARLKTIAGSDEYLSADESIMKLAEKVRGEPDEW